MKKIAVLTSGGDAPGMNAAIRAVVLACEKHNIDSIGYRYGYNGLLTASSRPLDAKLVHNLIQRGGTILHSGRCLSFKTDESGQLAAKQLESDGVDGLVVIGGDGSFKGAEHLSRFWKGKIIGLPGTIDNDIGGTDTTIGFYTAIETAMQSIDKVRDTADAFERLFVVEVMGRHAGFLALNAALASASNYALLPEQFVSTDATLADIEFQLNSRRKDVGHDSYIIVVAENIWPGGIDALTKALGDRTGAEVRPVILGHVQRGGSPVSQDRILATKLGFEAVNAMMDGKTCMMMGEIDGQMVSYPFEEARAMPRAMTGMTVDAVQALLNNRY